MALPQLPAAARAGEISRPGPEHPLIRGRCYSLAARLRAARCRCHPLASQSTSNTVGRPRRWATTTSRPSSSSRGWCPEPIWNGKPPGRLKHRVAAPRGIAACPHRRGNRAGSVPSTAPRRPPSAYLQRRRRDPRGTRFTQPGIRSGRCQCRRRGGLHTQWARR